MSGNYFIVITCGTDGKPRLPMRKQGKDYFLHDNLQAAYIEAKRLAAQHKEIKFGVFEWIGMVEFEKYEVVDSKIKIEVA